MPGILDQAKDWFSNIGKAYSSGAQQNRGMGRELQESMRMRQLGNQALGGGMPVAAPSAPPAGMSPQDLVHQNYQGPTGAQAVEKILGKGWDGPGGGFSNVRVTQPGSSVGSLQQR